MKDVLEHQIAAAMAYLRIGGVVAVLVAARPVQAQLAVPNDAGVAFGHVHLYVEDVDLHGRLWSELFDGTLVERDRFTAVRLPGTLIFLTEEEGTTSSRGTAMDHLGLAVRDLDAVLDEWRTLGYDVDSESAGPHGARTAFITIPGGVALELRHDPAISATAVMDHIHFFTAQNRELLAWYADIFAATRQDEEDDEAPTARVPGSALTFSASEEERAGTEGTVINHIGFEVEDMDGFAAMLQGRGVELVQGPFYVDVLDLWVAFFNDPSGVLVEVTEGLDHY